MPRERLLNSSFAKTDPIEVLIERNQVGIGNIPILARKANMFSLLSLSSFSTPLSRYLVYSWTDPLSLLSLHLHGLFIHTRTTFSLLHCLSHSLLPPTVYSFISHHLHNRDSARKESKRTSHSFSFLLLSSFFSPSPQLSLLSQAKLTPFPSQSRHSLSFPLFPLFLQSLGGLRKKPNTKAKLRGKEGGDKQL